MRALRVVGLTEDGGVVLEDPVRLERYTVPADERLRAAARGDLSRLGQIAIELESQLRPREIQARIRAGASVEQVAAAAGVPEQKIERFAYPVLLERFRTADNAQRAHPVRADGPDRRTLGEVVAHTFGLRGQEYDGARWDSWKGEDGRWVVALSWRAGRSDNRALWTFQPGAHGGTVTALDEHASDLVEGLPARPLRTVGAVVDMNRPEEEPPPAPAPVEQWRAAASDGYREHMPLAPEPPRPERGGTRSAPEPWRPAPPWQRQPEPAEARASDRGGETRPAEVRSERPAPEWAPATREEEPRPASGPEVRSNDAVASGLAAEAAGPDEVPDAAPAAATPAVAVKRAEQLEAELPGAASVRPPAPPAVPPEDAPTAPSAPDAPMLEAPATDAAPDGSAGAAAAKRRTKKGKPAMPSWDEVLLGVRGPR